MGWALGHAPGVHNGPAARRTEAPSGHRGLSFPFWSEGVQYDDVDCTHAQNLEHAPLNGWMARATETAYVANTTSRSKFRLSLVVRNDAGIRDVSGSPRGTARARRCASPSRAPGIMLAVCHAHRCAVPFPTAAPARRPVSVPTAAVPSPVPTAAPSTNRRRPLLQCPLPCRAQPHRWPHPQCPLLYRRLSLRPP